MYHAYKNVLEQYQVSLVILSHVWIACLRLVFDSRCFVFDPCAELRCVCVCKQAVKESLEEKQDELDALSKKFVTMLNNFTNNNQVGWLRRLPT